jgi:hypothetical protein
LALGLLVLARAKGRKTSRGHLYIRPRGRIANPLAGPALCPRHGTLRRRASRVGPLPRLLPRWQTPPPPRLFIVQSLASWGHKIPVLNGGHRKRRPIAPPCRPHFGPHGTAGGAPGKPPPLPPRPATNTVAVRGGIMGGCLAGGPPHPRKGTTENPATTAAGRFTALFTIPTNPSSPIHNPAATSKSLSRRRNALKKSGLGPYCSPAQSDALAFL